MNVRLCVTYLKKYSFTEFISKFFTRIKKNLFAFMAKRFFSVNSDKIVFLNFSGNYDCNPKAICEKIISENLDYILVWGVDNLDKVKDQFPDNVKLVKKGTFGFYKELSSSHFIIDNGVSCAHYMYKKKISQVLIETWHGSLGIKRFDRETNKDKAFEIKAIAESKMTDYLISCSSFESEIYQKTYWPDKEIWEIGHPRNDILFSDDITKSFIKQKVCSLYNIDANSNICLYAPTFRDNEALNVYENINVEKLLEALQKIKPGKWFVFFRLHYRDYSRAKEFANYKNMIDVSDFADISDLLAFVDVGITDYSSWICEYVLTRRPGFIFASDYNDYIRNDRLLAYPIDTLPFPVAYDMKQLTNNIENFDKTEYIKNVESILHMMGSVDDGSASEYAVQKIRNINEEL